MARTTLISLTVKQNSSSNFFNSKTKQFIEAPRFDAVTIEGPSAAIGEIYAKCLLMGQDLRVPTPYRGIGVDAKTKSVRRVA
ncbi:MAG: hypothetical protein O3A01_07695 [bacterium]|nr:hypothetical protein [bacterium]